MHDDVEAYVGDTPTDMLADAFDQTTKEEREKAALHHLLLEYSDCPEYCERIKQYEDQSVPEARFVKAVDKLMVMLIHLPNQGLVLNRHYTYESFLKSEMDLMARDGFKYAEFDGIKALRHELGYLLADRYLAASRSDCVATE
ncbi:MAG: HD domain-containing protein [Candidatus Chaera renei]|uniref:HD domain-containing protein n=1 Tax=Candidatus Chaera renei TaxID=2506947 RepID=A0A4Q0AJA8_9BACT|nr:MAG: HD domain-containing protein [Candidatus Chaera renei]